MKEHGILFKLEANVTLEKIPLDGAGEYRAGAGELELKTIKAVG